MMPVAVSVANCTLKPGRKPPSLNLMTRASGSVVDARASLVLFLPLSLSSFFRRNFSHSCAAASTRS